jgi:hypothetical protein
MSLVFRSKGAVGQDGSEMGHQIQSQESTKNLAQSDPKGSHMDL